MRVTFFPSFWTLGVPPKKRGGGGGSWAPGPFIPLLTHPCIWGQWTSTIFRKEFPPPPRMHCSCWFMAGGPLIKPACVSPVEGFSLLNLDDQWDNSCHNMQMSRSPSRSHALIELYRSILTLRRHLKIILFPVERPGDFILRLYPAAFFFFFLVWKILIFQSIFVRFSNGFHHCSQDDP